MKTRWLFNIFLCAVLLLVSYPVQAVVPAAQIKKQMTAHLEFIRNVFEAKYAPISWKKKYSGWNLNKAFESAKSRVQKLKEPTLKDYRYILKDFFNSTSDYHVSVRCFSTEQATLPFLVKGAEGRYFICHLDKRLLSTECRQLNVGDEILAFDGLPINTVIQELKKRELGHNTKETDQALAELLLTHRNGESGHVVPAGSISIKVKSKETGEIKDYAFVWRYSPEKIRDFAKLGSPRTESPIGATFAPFPQENASLRASGFFDKWMLCPFWSKESLLAGPSPHTMGVRSSFLPALGKIIWKTEKEDIFDAYIFELTSGERIGYVRIPHYVGDDVDIEEFTEIVKIFETHTEALVIDQLNNPGGSIFYLYALVSLLTDHPLPTPKHHLAITQEDVNIAVTWLPILDAVQDDETARQWAGETFDGYPIDYKFVELMRDFFRLIVNEWNEGHLYTKPTYLFGVDQIQPHAEIHYTKPLLVLTNNLCFSGGDFFPAIIQDGKRGIVFGGRTSGAGGYVLRTRFPNHLGIRDFFLTGSLAERIDEKPLENLGVTPDISYSYSVKDLQENYVEYTRSILNSIELLLDKSQRGL